MPQANIEFIRRGVMDKFTKYLFLTHFLKLVIEEDLVGYYLIVYKDPTSTVSDEDYLLDTLEDAFQEAQERFGVSKIQWILVN